MADSMELLQGTLDLLILQTLNGGPVAWHGSTFGSPDVGGWKKDAMVGRCLRRLPGTDGYRQTQRAMTMQKGELGSKMGAAYPETNMTCRRRGRRTDKSGAGDGPRTSATQAEPSEGRQSFRIRSGSSSNERSNKEGDERGDMLPVSAGNVHPYSGRPAPGPHVGPALYSRR